MSKPYPMLYRFDGRRVPGVPSSLLPAVLRAVRSVERRTNCRAWWNVNTGTLMWLLGHGAGVGGVHQEVVFERGRYLPVDPERTCRAIRACRMSWAKKLAAVERGRRAHREAMAAEAARTAADMESEYRDRVKFLTRKLVDGSRSRPCVTVP